MHTVETIVYLYAELDDRGKERARQWLDEAMAQDICDDISEQLTDALHDAYGPDATVTGWDYYRSSVTIGGTLVRPAGVVGTDGPGAPWRGCLRCGAPDHLTRECAS